MSSHVHSGLRHTAEFSTASLSEAYDDLVRHLNEIVICLDREGRITEANPAIERHWGYCRSDVAGKLFTEFVHPNDVQLAQEFFAGLLTSALPPREFRIVDGSGATRWCRSSGWSRCVTGGPAGVVTVITDITEQRQTQENLQRAEQKFRTIFEEAIVGIFQTSPEGKYVIANPALAAMLGYDSPEELQISVQDVAGQVYVDPSRRDVFRALLARDGRVRNFECELYRKNRSKMWVSVNARAIYNDGKIVGYEGTNEDITERRMLERQLLQAQRLDAVGQLAGGIAHDFNNLLGVVLGQSELLLRQARPEDPIRRRIDQISQAAQRAVSLTAQLLAFSRQQIMLSVALDLNVVIENLNEMMSRLIGEDIVIVNRLDPALARLKGDPTQIEQIVLNLALNARDAMPRGGTLTVETSNVTVDQVAQRDWGVKPGSYVLLAISDTGVGMDEATMAQIFEPFFTTKEEGKGTGLGLATVYGIVKQSGGHISVSSEPESGTTFQIYFPQTDDPLTMDAAPGSTQVPQLSRGRETVLLVEDFGAMRNLTREFLESAGYRVLEADDAASALQLADRNEGRIALMIADVVMPRINGASLAERLRSARPDTEVLFVSGHTDEAVFRHGVHIGDRHFLHKPFTRDALITRVEELLHAAC